MPNQTIEKIRGKIVIVDSVNNYPITISGRFPRIVTVRDEPFEFVRSPEMFIQRLKTQRLSADIFTFMQELADTTPKFSYHMELDAHAMVPITTYDYWWKKQIDNKSRNMIRKAQK